MANATGTSEKPKPFELAVPDADIELLQKKLELVRFPDELDGAGWDYGSPLADVKRLAAHWNSGFDWRKSEAEINKLPMFTRDIEVDGFGTLSVHYVHQVSDVRNAIPLLFVHGWPGHFLEVRKLLPLLTAGGEDHPSFHVVAPSLPGFGFSEAPKKPGFKGPQYAELLNKLMLSLGYDEYVYQGGDWGHILGTHTVFHYGNKHVKAWHTNMPWSSPPTLMQFPLLYIQTMLAFALDSAAKNRLVAAALIEWVSIYYFSRAGPAASTRIYFEMSNGGSQQISKSPGWTSVPLGVSYFPGEMQLPRLWTHTIGNVVFESEHDAGGHFAAFEVPEKLAGDLRKMYRKGGPAHGVVPGRVGYDE
ncbi:hypothetical protein GSI_14704 [Ganoderma sinense ZZ0214-1]|uniref:Epoxide hydrolase N-terminal domain-containing protein n=1 Tax=Ganoderma sinense ZZ0214-1 TaxID=1077348 RepID=A0A2G8RPG4_9APHY|nr:hypothetical protein GSI_14704 [Ganoderma sinense ZZ0214-1]